MRRTRQPELQPSKRKQIGAQLDEALWNEIRKVAIDQRRPAAHVMDDAMRLYLKSHKVAGVLGERRG